MCSAVWSASQQGDWRRQKLASLVQVVVMSCVLCLLSEGDHLFEYGQRLSYDCRFLNWGWCSIVLDRHRYPFCHLPLPAIPLSHLFLVFPPWKGIHWNTILVKFVFLVCLVLLLLHSGLTKCLLRRLSGVGRLCCWCCLLLETTWAM